MYKEKDKKYEIIKTTGETNRESTQLRVFLKKLTKQDVNL